MKKLFLITIGILLAATTWAGPFGIDMGMTIDQVKAVTTSGPIELNPGVWEIKPKKTHPDIETYLIYYHEGFGVTGVRAISKDIISSSYGTELKSRVEAIAGSLSTIYGKPTKEFDFVPRGALWNEAHEYMMSLRMDERNYIKFWDDVTKENITNIMLKASATSRTKGYYILDYIFANSSKADEDRKSSNATAL
jgi:hypothetical protein